MSESKKKGRKGADGGESRSARTSWELVCRALACALLKRLYLYGPPGVGKTWAAYHEGRIERGVYALTLTQETPAAELRGSYLPKGGQWLWCDGPVIQAMRAGARLVLNELSHASDDALSFLHPILERPETARITLPTGETVFPAEGFSVVATDNLPPSELPAALRDRFDGFLELSEPHPKALEALPEWLRETARRCNAVDEERRASVRAWLTLAALEPLFGLEDAACVVFGAERGTQIHDALRIAKEEVNP